MLEQSMQALQTSWIDLWQFHDIREHAEVGALEDPDGAYAALVEAKERGDVRAIGVTGHYDPAVLRAALECVRFDTVLLPINPAEGAMPDGFEHSVVPAARARGMSIIGMKAFARGLLFGPDAGAISPADALAYALSADVDVIVVGCDDVAQVQANAALAGDARPLDAAERRALERRAAPFAERLAYYRAGSAA